MTSEKTACLFIFPWCVTHTKSKALKTVLDLEYLTLFTTQYSILTDMDLIFEDYYYYY